VSFSIQIYEKQLQISVFREKHL